jgi:sterol desaturase/sphingolipid hydroxylase (fatty acid hydroxylase superfamily)
MQRVWSAWTGLLERAVDSPTHYWAVMGTDVVSAAAFLALGARRSDAPPVVLIPAFAAGFMAWGLLEYVMHRWVLHGPPTFARDGHLRHHADSEDLLSTPIFVSGVVGCIIWALLSLVLPPSVAAVAVGGTYWGYVYYSTLHHLLHHRGLVIARSAYFRRMHLRHRVHHANSRVNFGVSTSVWDRVFRTALPRPRRQHPS